MGEEFNALSVEDKRGWLPSEPPEPDASQLAVLLAESLHETVAEFTQQVWPP